MTDRHAIPALDRKGLRQFGFATGVMVVLIFGLFFPWLLDREFPQWPWAVLGVFGGMAVAIPDALRPVYHGWMRVALLLGRITTPLMLGMAFFLVLTPMGLLMRLFGSDPMRREKDAGAQTYRVASTKTDRERLERPF